MEVHHVYKTVEPDIALMIENLQRENAQLRELLEELFYGLEWTLDEQNVELMRKVEKELADV